MAPTPLCCWAWPATEPDTIDPDQIAPTVAQIRSSQRLPLLGEHSIPWIDKEHMLLRRKKPAPPPQRLCFRAFDAQGKEIAVREYYSIGGGFVVDEQGQRVINPGAAAASGSQGHGQGLPYPYSTGAELLAQCRATGLSMAQVTAANEQHWHSADEVQRQLLRIWQTMAGAVQQRLRGHRHLPAPCMCAAARGRTAPQPEQPPEAALRDRCPCSTG